MGIKNKEESARESDVLGNRETSYLPSSCERLIRTYSDTAATSSKMNASVAYLASVMWPISTERRVKYLTDHGYTSLEFLPVQIAKLEGEDK